MEEAARFEPSERVTKAGGGDRRRAGSNPSRRASALRCDRRCAAEWWVGVVGRGGRLAWFQLILGWIGVSVSMRGLSPTQFFLTKHVSDSYTYWNMSIRFMNF